MFRLSNNALARFLRADVPFDPARSPFFYGWAVLIVATLGIVMSIPGQTMGVSVFTDHLIGATGVSRFELSNAYLVGTVTSGALLPFGGRLLDRFGARATALASTLLLALTLLYLASVDRIAHAIGGPPGTPGSVAVALIVLGLGFTSLRFSGQGMLTMVSRTMLGKWFEQRRGLVAGLSGIFVSFGFASAPLLFSAWIGAAGWRGAWIGIALVVGVGMGLVAWLFYRDNPEECGLRMDGRAHDDTEQSNGDEPLAELTRAQALRTVAFWAVTLALSSHGLAMTGITFHIVDLGAAGGLVEQDAVAIFLPMAVLSTGVGFVVGHVSDKVRIKWLIVAMMCFQALGLVCVADLGDPMRRWLAIAGLGLGGGFFGPLSTVALPRFFGRLHLGAISGFQMMCMVVSSAVGPTYMAASQSWLGSYAPGLYAATVLPASVLLLSLAATNPRARRSDER